MNSPIPKRKEREEKVTERGLQLSISRTCIIAVAVTASALCFRTFSLLWTLAAAGDPVWPGSH
jgi:hypothetical protein